MDKPNDLSDDIIYAVNSVQSVQVILASISLVFTASVSYLLMYNYKDLVSGKPFIHIVLMMALSDTVSGISLAFGYPINNALCGIQGFIFVFSTRLSWLFLDFLVAQLYYFAKYQKLLFNIKQMHYIIWPFSIILQLAPFLTKTGYGSPADDVDDMIQPGICFYSDWEGSVDAYYYWSTFGFVLELFLSFTFVSTITILILCQNFPVKDSTSLTIALLPVINSVKATVIYYPVSQLVTYVPGIIYQLYHIIYIHHNGKYPPHYVSIQDILVAIIPLNYIFFTIIFYYKTDEALKKYLDMFRYMFNIRTEDNTINDDRMSSIENVTRITESIN